MKDSINPYGDRLIENQGRGSDIASQRFDELDLSAYEKGIEFAVAGHLRAADLGAGRCAFINHLANDLAVNQIMDSCTLFAVDSADFREFAAPGVHFIISDIVDFLKGQPPGSLDLIYSQRTIHYLDHAAAIELACSAFQSLRPGGYLYLSASGLFSELSEGYAHGSAPISDRFSRLAPPMQEKHGIREPVCLYAPAELAQLAGGAGFTVQSVKSSTFGNVKLIGLK